MGGRGAERHGWQGDGAARAAGGGAAQLSRLHPTRIANVGKLAILKEEEVVACGQSGKPGTRARLWVWIPVGVDVAVRLDAAHLGPQEVGQSDDVGSRGYIERHAQVGALAVSNLEEGLRCRGDACKGGARSIREPWRPLACTCSSRHHGAGCRRCRCRLPSGRGRQRSLVGRDEGTHPLCSGLVNSIVLSEDPEDLCEGQGGVKMQTPLGKGGPCPLLAVDEDHHVADHESDGLGT